MSRAPPKPSPTDASASQSRNEYIPSFISKKPFYIDDSTLSETDYLEHQRLQSLPQDTLAKSKWYDRGRKLGPAATKFRKGACENCGAMTHKTKECLSRPRKQGAKWTGKDIQADEVVEEVKAGWDAKRDRWNGYDAREYASVVKEYEELEALKKAAAADKNGQKHISNGDENDNDNDDLETESAKYAEETDMGRNQPTSTRNLRIREDTAKYLINLDLDSAKYDPKTRSMADAGKQPSDTNTNSIADEGFTHSFSTSGDAAAFSQAQRYAWETQERGPLVPGGKKLHLQANPTEGEILLKQQTEAAAAKRAAKQRALLEKYGGSEHLQPAPFRAAENERYVEYDESGAVKGETKEKRIATSKYKEDVLINNHTSVWGSWWKDFKWGYACCRSSVRNSYCTGEEGRRAFEEAERVREGDLLIEDGKQSAEQQQGERDEEENDRTAKPDHKDKEQVTTTASKKRTLQEMRDGVTEEEMEEFKRNRATKDDPMAKLLGRDELVH